ncbi:MAG: dTDP-4-dehydrorhamnose reductase [Desulfovibrionaceae bacterium]|nr:dTDP-4-dehydrorhamnose reductase [Desulfovibrionaceae bacterium]
MTKALILGGRTGLLGQALMRTLAARGWEVSALGREDGQVDDCAFLSECIGTTQPDVIFNTIAWTQVDAAEDQPDDALHWNRGLPDALARCIKGRPVHLVHYSTDFVFPGTGERPWTEDAPTRPLNAYGRTKLAGEQVLRQLIPQQCCILRTAWLFGPGRRNFVSTMLELGRSRDVLHVVHDQVGSPTYSLDLAQWSAVLAERRTAGLFHAVNGGRASWCELASEAVALAGAHCRVEPIASADWPQKAVRPAFSVLDTSRLAAELGVPPRPWPQALRDYIFTELHPQT